MLSKYISFDDVNLNSILRGTSKALSIYATFKLSKWLLNYICLIIKFNKMPGKPMIPFLGCPYEILTYKSGFIYKEITRANK